MDVQTLVAERSAKGLDVIDRDKLIERERYELRSREQIDTGSPVEALLGSQTLPRYLRAPYLCYEQQISDLVRAEHRVLELGAGTGLHTWALLRTGAQVVASDISPNSLALLRRRFDHTAGILTTEVADLEDLPFEESSFDVVACAGCLSYGDPSLVDAGIRRVLRPGGTLICVDTLNHNPIYRLNRFLHYLRGNRSLSTLRRMPDLARIRSLSGGFGSASVRFFGAFSYAMPVVARLAGDAAAQRASDRLDALVGVQRSAFKFVLAAQGLS